MNINRKLLHSLQLFRLLFVLFTFLVCFSNYIYSSPLDSSPSDLKTSDETSNEVPSETISPVPQASDENCNGGQRCSEWKSYALFLEQRAKEQPATENSCESSESSTSASGSTGSRTVELSVNSLPSLSSLNAGAYNISGTCDSRLGNVTVVIGKPNVQKSLICTSQNVFSESFNLERVSSNPVIATVSQEQANSNGASIISKELSVSIVNEINYFITKWNFRNNYYRFTLPLKSNKALRYNFLVNWGDGSPAERVTSFDDLDKVHTYKKAGNYTIKIFGICEGFQNDGVSRNMLLEVANLGQVGWKDLSHAFKNNFSLTKFLGGDTSKVTNMSHMFTLAKKGL